MSEADRDKWDERWRAVRASGAVEAPSAVIERLGEARDPGPLAGDGAPPLLPVRGRALDLALERARAAGLDGSIAAARVDFDVDPLPQGPWNLVLSFHFLDRRVLEAVPDALAPGGTLVAIHPTRTNLERHDRPSARFLLEPGELARLVAPRLTVVHYEEGWLLGGRHEACAVARRRE